MFKEKKTRIYWCKSCKTPVISDSLNKTVTCKLCRGKAEYMCSDARPVFLEKRLLLKFCLQNRLNLKKALYGHQKQEGTTLTVNHI